MTSPMRKLQETQAEAQGAGAPQKPDSTVNVAKERLDMSKDQRTQLRVWRGSVVGKYGMFKPPSKDRQSGSKGTLAGQFRFEDCRRLGSVLETIPRDYRRELRDEGQLPQSEVCGEVEGEVEPAGGHQARASGEAHIRYPDERAPQQGGVTRRQRPKSGWRKAPLGIEKEIKTCRIFPMSDEEPQEQGLPDAAAQLHRGDMTNYESVENNKEEAEIELSGYEERLHEAPFATGTVGEVPQRHHLAVGADPEGQGEPGSEETSIEEVARQRQGPSPGEVGTSSP